MILNGKSPQPGDQIPPEGLIACQTSGPATTPQAPGMHFATVKFDGVFRSAKEAADFVRHFPKIAVEAFSAREEGK